MPSDPDETPSPRLADFLVEASVHSSMASIDVTVYDLDGQALLGPEAMLRDNLLRDLRVRLLSGSTGKELRLLLDTVLVDSDAVFEGATEVQLTAVFVAARLKFKANTRNEFKGGCSIEVCPEAEFVGQRLADKATAGRLADTGENRWGRYRWTVPTIRKKDQTGREAVGRLQRVKPALERVPEDAERLRALLASQARVNVHYAIWKEQEVYRDCAIDLEYEIWEILFAGHVATLQATEMVEFDSNDEWMGEDIDKCYPTPAPQRAQPRIYPAAAQTQAPML